MPAGQFILCKRCACRTFYSSSSLLPPPILVSLSILAFLIPARTSPSRACRRGFESFSAVSLSRSMFMFIPPTKPPTPSIHYSSPLAIYRTTFHPKPHTHHTIRTSPPHDQILLSQPFLSVSRFPTVCCPDSDLFVLTTWFARLASMFIMQLSLLCSGSPLRPTCVSPFRVERPHCYPRALPLVRLCSLS